MIYYLKNLPIDTIMGQGGSSGVGGSDNGGGWGQSSSSGWGQTPASGQSWGQTNASQAAACNSAQDRADASCGACGSSDLSGRNGAGMDMVNQGQQCLRDQANADNVCGRK